MTVITFWTTAEEKECITQELIMVLKKMGPFPWIRFAFGRVWNNNNFSWQSCLFFTLTFSIPKLLLLLRRWYGFKRILKTNHNNTHNIISIIEFSKLGTVNTQWRFFKFYDKREPTNPHCIIFSLLYRNGRFWPSVNTITRYFWWYNKMGI